MMPVAAGFMEPRFARKKFHKFTRYAYTSRPVTGGTAIVARRDYLIAAPAANMNCGTVA